MPDGHSKYGIMDIALGQSNTFSKPFIGVADGMLIP